jgi:hypothetical protein
MLQRPCNSTPARRFSRDAMAALRSRNRQFSGRAGRYGGQVTPAAHLRALRRAGVATQAPPTRCIPAPHASRTCVIIASGCSAGASGMACAADAKAMTKATAINLIIAYSILRTDKASHLILRADQRAPMAITNERQRARANPDANRHIRRANQDRRASQPRANQRRASLSRPSRHASPDASTLRPRIRKGFRNSHIRKGFRNSHIRRDFRIRNCCSHNCRIHNYRRQP